VARGIEKMQHARFIASNLKAREDRKRSATVCEENRHGAEHSL
jgi:hypothetical protein